MSEEGPMRRVLSEEIRQMLQEFSDSEENADDEARIRQILQEDETEFHEAFEPRNDYMGEIVSALQTPLTMNAGITDTEGDPAVSEEEPTFHELQPKPRKGETEEEVTVPGSEDMLAVPSTSGTQRTTSRPKSYRDISCSDEEEEEDEDYYASTAVRTRRGTNDVTVETLPPTDKSPLGSGRRMLPTPTAPREVIH